MNSKLTSETFLLLSLIAYIGSTENFKCLVYATACKHLTTNY